MAAALFSPLASLSHASPPTQLCFSPYLVVGGSHFPREMPTPSQSKPDMGVLFSVWLKQSMRTSAIPELPSPLSGPSAHSRWERAFSSSPESYILLLWDSDILHTLRFRMQIPH